MIFEDVTDGDKEGSRLEYPVPSCTASEVHSPASAAANSQISSNSPSGMKSGIILNVCFILLLLLKRNKPFLPIVIVSHC